MAALAFLLSVLLAHCIAQKVEVTVYYDSTTKEFTLKTVYDTSGAAFARWDNNITSTGWAFLELHTDMALDLNVQFYAAGMAEGYVSAGQMEYYATNQYAQWGFTPQSIPSKIYTYMTQNMQFMRTHVPSSDPVEQQLWRGVNLTLSQYDGICAGYNLARQQNTSGVWMAIALNAVDISLINAAGDMETIVDVYGGFQPVKNITQYNRTDCSGLVRLVRDSNGNVADLTFGQSTWRGYMLMNRVYKMLQIGPTVISMSSQPGFISSKDDFYVNGEALAIYETTNSIYNQTLYNYLTPQSLLTWVRSAVATRLSRTAEQWTVFFARWNSGTYNNQFGIVDMKMIHPANKEKNLPPGTFWIIEQIPGFTQSGDLTDVLNKQAYFPSYNIPYFQNIYNMSGYESDVPSQSYTQCPRALIFARDAPKVENLADQRHIMRYNEYTTDPYSQGDPANAVCSRYDLRAGGPSAFGGVDSKVTSFLSLFPWGSPTVSNMTYTVNAISGPTTQDPTVTPPFSWANPPFTSVSHVGQPTVWNFTWVDLKFNPFV